MRADPDVGQRARIAPPDLRTLATVGAAALLASLLIFSLARTAWRLYEAPRLPSAAAMIHHANAAPARAAALFPVRLKRFDDHRALHGY